MEDLQGALDGAGVLERVQFRHPRIGRQRVVDLGVVLHGAGALADVDVEVAAQILLGQPQEVLEHAHLADFRQGRGLLAHQSRGQGRQTVAHLGGDARFHRRHHQAAFARLVQFEQQLLIPLGLVKTVADLDRAFAGHVISLPGSCRGC